MSFETSYDFTWGLASSSDRPTQLWMILSFYLFACVGQEQQSPNSNRMIGRCFSFCFFLNPRVQILMPLRSAQRCVCTSSDFDRARGDKRWELPMRSAGGSKSEWKMRLDGCEIAKILTHVPAGHLLADGSHGLLEPWEGSYHSHGLNWKHTTEISMLNSQSLIFIIRATFETFFGCLER